MVSSSASPGPKPKASCKAATGLWESKWTESRAWSKAYKVQGSVPEGKSDGERRARKQMQVEARPRWPHATKTMPDAQLAGLRAEVRWNHHILELLVTGRKGTEFICRFPLSLDSHLSKLVPRGFSAPSLPVVPPPPQVAVGQPSSVPSARWQG